MDPKELFGRYFDQQKFEHELINRHITWLLTSQTILIAAYGLIFKDGSDPTKELLKCLIPICGLATSISLLIGVSSLILAKRCILKDYQKDYQFLEKQWPVKDNLRWSRPVWGVRRWIERGVLLPVILLPLIFSFVWAKLLNLI